MPQAGLPPGTVLDVVESYAGMRKIALGRTYRDGPLRILLNNKPILQLGLLDQARTSGEPDLARSCCSAHSTLYQHNLSTIQQPPALVDCALLQRPVLQSWGCAEAG